MNNTTYMRFTAQIFCLALLMALLAIPGSRQMAMAEDDDTLFETLQITKYAERQDVPEFSLQSVDGEEKSLNDYKGNVVLLNFWTTW